MGTNDPMENGIMKTLWATTGVMYGLEDAGNVYILRSIDAVDAEVLNQVVTTCCYINT